MVRIFAACVAGLLASTVLAAPLSSSLRNSDVTDVAAAAAAAIPASKAVLPEPQVTQDTASEGSADAGSAPKQKEKGDKGGEEDKDKGIKFTIRKSSLMKWSGPSSAFPTNVQLAIQAGGKVLEGSKPVIVNEDLL